METENNSYVSLPYFGIPKILPYLAKYRKWLLIIIIGGLAGSGVDIILPLFNRYAINNFIAGGTTKGLWGFVAAYLAVLAVQVVMNTIGTYISASTEISVSTDLRNASFAHLQTLSFSYFNQNNVGYVHARVMSDTGRIGELVSWNLTDLVWNSAYVIGVFAVMLSINVKLTAMVAVLVPVALVIITYFQRKLVALNRKIRELNSKITGNFNEGITGAKTIKTLVVEEKMEENFREDSSEMRRTSIRKFHYSALFSATIAFVSSMALAIVLWQGGGLSMAGLMQLGTLSVFMSYAQGLMEPVQWVVEIISALIAAQVNIERFTKLMDTQSDVADSPEVIEKYGDAFNAKRENWEELVGDVEFRDVTFKYPDGDEYVLSHFNLKVPKGSNVAIVGETGAGKSTLVNLVCRFFEPTEGQVLIDGRDAKERSALWLHENIGYVLQSPHLFSGTVRENLKYGNPDATDEEILEALKIVSAEGVIDKMEGGLDAEVGEGGDLLSTGEKQLLSFARAILADPKILVLDEATSSIDTVTEKLIQDAIGKVTKGRTSFVIAHRLSTVVDADVILVVRDGKIMERGTHAELMRARGYYYGLFTRQFVETATEEAF